MHERLGLLDYSHADTARWPATAHFYPAMTMVFVSALLDEPGKIELEATAVIPEQD